MSKKQAAATNLPEWDLSDFYAGINAKTIGADITRAEKLCAAFAKSYNGKIAKISGAALAKAIAEYETIQDVLGKLGSYAGLVFAKNMQDPKIAQFYQNTSEKLTTLSSLILFFTLDINKLSDAAMKEKLKTPALKKYASWFRDVRAFRIYDGPSEVHRHSLGRRIVKGERPKAAH